MGTVTRCHQCGGAQSHEPGCAEVMRGALEIAGDDAKAAALMNLRHRAHMYHGVSKMDPPNAAKKDVAITDLVLAGVRMTHALEGRHLGGTPCDYCVAAGVK